MRPNLKENYDRDRWRPSHERILEDPQFQELTDIVLKEEEKRQRGWDKRYQKMKGADFLKLKHFVPINLEDGLEGPQSKALDKVTNIIIGLGMALIVLAFIFIGPFMDITGFGLVGSLIIFALLGIFIMYIAISRWVYKVDDRRKRRAEIGGNTQLNIGEIWGINPSGIRARNIDNKENTIVQYTGRNTLVLKILKDSVLTTKEEADWDHYEGLEGLENVLSKNNFNFSKINLRYDITNDPIWDIKNKNLDKSAKDLGEMTEVAANLLNYHYNLTRDLHNVTVTYYLIQPNFRAREMPFEYIVDDIRQQIARTQSTLLEVTNKEFVNLLRNYYGLRYLDMEQIAEFIAAGEDIFGVSVDMVSYMNSRGELVKLKDEYQHKVKENYTQRSRIRNEKDLEEEIKIEMEQESIYGDKRIEQRDM